MNGRIPKVKLKKEKIKQRYSTLQVYQRSYSQVGHIPPKMSDKFESTPSNYKYLVGHRGCTPSIWLDVRVDI
jgi:hypothetical protein